MFEEDLAARGIGGLAGVAISSVGITLADVESIVSIVCSIVGLLFTISMVLVIPVIKKIIAAKKDGKVTIDEVEDIVDTAKQGLEELNNEIDTIKKK